MVEKVGCTLAMKLLPRCGTRTCLGATTMRGWTTGVLICWFIVAPLLLLNHNDLFEKILDLEYLPYFIIIPFCSLPIVSLWHVEESAHAP